MSLWTGGTHTESKGAIKAHWESVRSHVHEKRPHRCLMTRAFFMPFRLARAHFTVFIFQLVVSPQIVLFDAVRCILLYHFRYGLISIFLLWHFFFALAFFFACACRFFLFINLGVCLIFPWFEPHFCCCCSSSFLGLAFMARSVRWIRIRHERTCHTCTSSYLTRAWLRFSRNEKKNVFKSTWNRPFRAVGHWFCGSFKSRVAQSHY